MGERVLVTGGCGYIGSHTVALLLELGHKVCVVDDLSRGTEDALHRAEFISGRRALFEQCDLLDSAALQQVFHDWRPDAVVHLAAFKSVEESVRDPERYEAVNVEGTRSLIEAMSAAWVDRVVFASTAVVYDARDGQEALSESAPLHPISPYARTKYAAEELLRTFAIERHAGVVNLRFFNVAGAHPSGTLGEPVDRPRNLLPVVLNALRDDREIPVFGTDWDTRDGTCIRDYVHVMDIAWALVDSLDMTHGHGSCRTWNLGTGTGTTVLEVIEAAARRTGRRPRVVHARRRAGDPAVLVADASSIREQMGWSPRFGLDDMVQHAWAWMQTL